MSHPLVPQTTDLTDEFTAEVTDQAIPHHPVRVVPVERRECEAPAAATAAAGAAATAAAGAAAGAAAAAGSA
ncbi:MAG: hypothetical protein K0U84_19785 [Actinomycetia bacterium]|nr:hypothetical protein [Actinomycetes bacterium]